jgi:hypothetical protein
MIREFVIDFGNPFLVSASAHERGAPEREPLREGGGGQS